MVAEGGKVATYHTVYAVKKDNSPIEVNISAIFEIDKDGKLIGCHETTQFVKGNKRDADLGACY